MTQNVTIKAFNWLSISKTFGFTLICQVINNTIIDSQRWRARILQLVKLQTFITNGSKENDNLFFYKIFKSNFWRIDTKQHRIRAMCVNVVIQESKFGHLLIMIKLPVINQLHKNYCQIQ